MSRARAAGAGYRALNHRKTDNFEVRASAEVPRGTVIINYNDEDEDLVKEIYNPKVLDSVFDKAAKGLVVSAAFTTAFQGIAITGLVAGRGPNAATTEIFDRVLPETPDVCLQKARDLKKLVKSNLDKTKSLATATAHPRRNPPVSSAGRSKDNGHSNGDGNGNGGSGNGNGGSGNGNGGDMDVFSTWWF